MAAGKPPPGRRGARRPGGDARPGPVTSIDDDRERGRAEDRLTTASGYVATKIRETILAGGVPLGSRLDQQALADQLQVSIIPIREGLRVLEAEGLVRIRPRRGAFVAELSIPELREIGWVRERLEELALRLAAPGITPENLGRLQRLNSRMRRVAASARPDQWLELNRLWHFTIYDAGETTLLADMIRSLWDRSLLYRLDRLSKVQNRHNSVDQHDRVLTHLTGGETAAAARSLRYHIRTATGETLAAWSRYQGDGTA